MYDGRGDGYDDTEGRGYQAAAPCDLYLKDIIIEYQLLLNTAWIILKVHQFNPNIIEGGGERPCEAKFKGKRPRSQNNKTALTKQISQYDTPNSNKNT